jgi:hypothetical protein
MITFAAPLVGMEAMGCSGAEREGALVLIAARVARRTADSTIEVLVESRTFVERPCIENPCVKSPWMESPGVNIELLPAFLRCLLLAAPIR